MQVTCVCGKVLIVPDSQAGKTVRCPACQKIFKVVGSAAPSAEAPPTRIQVDCACGKKLSAPLSAGGKKIHCPKCNAELVVPAPPPPKPGSAPAPARPPAAPAPAKPPPAPAPGKVIAPASYATKPGAPGSAPVKPPPNPHEDLAFELDMPLADAPAPAPAPKPAAAKPAPAKAAAPAAAAPAARPKAAPSAPPDDSPGGEAEKAEYGLSAPKCPNCKAELAMGAQFCVECGTALATGAKVQAVAAAKKKKGINMSPEMIKKIAIGAVAVIALGFGGYMAYKSLWAPRGTKMPKPAGVAPKGLQKGMPPKASTKGGAAD